MVCFDVFCRTVEVMKFSYPSDYGFKTHKATDPTRRDKFANDYLTSLSLQAVCLSPSPIVLLLLVLNININNYFKIKSINN